MTETSTTNDQAPVPGHGKRKKLVAAVLAAFAAAGIGWGSYWALVARWVESTDDAYVDGNVVQITPQIAGTVVAIDADDTDFVHAGQPLIELDRSDATVALERAQAALAQTTREVSNLYAATAQLRAAVGLREVDLTKARQDLARRERLAGSGAISGEDLQHARETVHRAQSALQVAQQQLAGNLALTAHTNVAQHPKVTHAAAQVRDAWLNVHRTRLPAPVAGIVAKRNVQVGQRVAPGAALMAIVPPEQMWVDANFKEGQLRKLRVGQPVTLHADAYGSKIEFHGLVAGLGAGTGSAFALLPAQNATGNWIKVVQRVPVRIALDPEELARHPLRVGLSMTVDVDVHRHDGQSLRPAPDPSYRTEVFDEQADGANALIARIIASNTAPSYTAGASAPTAPARSARQPGAPARLTETALGAGAAAQATRAPKSSHEARHG